MDTLITVVFPAYVKDCSWQSLITMRYVSVYQDETNGSNNTNSSLCHVWQILPWQQESVTRPESVCLAPDVNCNIRPNNTQLKYRHGRWLLTRPSNKKAQRSEARLTVTRDRSNFAGRDFLYS